MAEVRNPYAPTRASLEHAQKVADPTAAGVWRQGKILVVLREHDLPGRCIRCNEPAEPPTRVRKVYWHHPTIYLLILLNIIIYVIVGLIARRTATVAPGLCRDHKKRRRTLLAAGWIAVLAGISAVFVGMGYNSGLLVAGVLVAFAGVLTGLFGARLLYAKRIDKTHLYLKGCGGEFLDSLPEFDGGG
jgi:hypothetical protein